MNPKKIYIVRHGQTDYNLKGIVQGRGVDSDINEKGEYQARKFFESYQDIPFERVFVSALKRTRQSVSRFIDLGIPVEKRPGLDEIDWGYRELEKITSEENAYYHSLVSAWQRGETDKRIKGGESPEDVQQRLLPVIEEWRNMDFENVLVCTHGRTMRILLSTLLNYPLSEMDQFEHSNLTLYKVVLTGSIFRIDLFNDLYHLR